jgi:tetratricopeptide (TPR) repeat protein
VDLVEGAIQLGWLTYAQGEGVERAAAQFDRATAATPRRGGGHYQKARLFALEKRYADADEMFALALRREPGRKEWLVAYATNARNAGDLATAINRYGEVLRRFPNHANAYHELAEAYRLSGMVKAAIDASQAAIGLSDKPRWAYHLRAARLYESIGEGEEAAEQYRIVLNLDSANNTALDALERLQANE